MVCSSCANHQRLIFISFRDALFDSTIPHVFQTPYQNAPLDLGTDSFYYSRASKIEEILKRIENGHAESMLESAFQNFDAQCRGVHWDRMSLQDLQEVSKCTCLLQFLPFDNLRLPFALEEQHCLKSADI
jgi:hypothetical protein